MKTLRTLFSKTKKPPPTPAKTPFSINEPQFISLIHSSKTLKHLHQIHAQIILHQHSSNSRIITQLISKSSSHINYTLSVFSHFQNPNLYLYNSLIRALAENGFHMTSISHFTLMLKANVKPNWLTYPFVLKSVAALQEGWLGMEIHCSVLKTGINHNLVLVYLVDMYCKVGFVEYARQVFDENPERNVLVWNVLINGYCKAGRWEKGMELFWLMPDKYVSSWNTLLDGLMRCGEVDKAIEVWGLMDESEKDVVSWTTVMNGFLISGGYGRALSLFEQMVEQGVEVNEKTVGCAITACGKAGALETGRRIHEYVVRSGIGVGKGVVVALVDMYAKCGSVEEAGRVFDGAEEKDIRMWSVMIWGCAVNGCLDMAVDCFNRMKASGIKPDGVVFLAIITACLHAGNIDQGLHFFTKMTHDYSIEPTMKHYTLIVDLYGRAGRLNQALKFIKNMPIDPDFVTWGALFSACRAHKNVQMAEYVSEKLLELEPKHPGGYVFLSNVYANAGKWQEVEKVRARMKNKGVGKEPGWSFIEIDGKVTSFIAGDRLHTRWVEIHNKLDEIVKSVKKVGYVPETDWVLHNIEEEEKEESLGSHSEKLALAFGVLSGLKVIRIVKNLKICGDCHSLIKCVSEVMKREIVVRDIKRFHHFRNGSCSCQDYW